jgi:hypothetical protein
MHLNEQASRPTSAEHCERDAEADGIEITPEMIEAGMEEYGSHWTGLRDADDDVAREMLVAAFLAMYRAFQKS